MGHLKTNSWHSYFNFTNCNKSYPIVMFKPNIFVFVLVFLLAITVDISEAKGRGGGRGGSRGSSGGGYRYRGSSGGYYSGGGGGTDYMIFVYVILGILGFCFLLWVLYQCSECESVEDDEIMKRVNNQEKRREDNFNSAAMNMPAKPDFNNLPSN